MVELLVVAALIVDGNRILAAKRLPGGAASEQWEFPGGKVEAGETPQGALAREIHEELGLNIVVGSPLGIFKTVVGARCIALQCHWCGVTGGQLRLTAHTQALYLQRHELLPLDWALPDVPVVQAILASGLPSSAP